MHLDGDKEDVKLIEMIVKEMMFTINNKGFVLPEDIREYLASLKNGEPSTMNGNGEESVVLYTHKGSVNARTNGQKKYLEAVKENDIVTVHTELTILCYLSGRCVVKFLFKRHCL